MISKKIPFNKLSSEEQIMVLEWMINGIHTAIENIVKSKTHMFFVSSLHGGKAFNPVDVWQSLGESSQSHFDHAKKAIGGIGKMIDVLDMPTIKKTGEESPQKPTEKPADSKKSSEKKKR